MELVDMFKKMDSEERFLTAIGLKVSCAGDKKIERIADILESL